MRYLRDKKFFCQREQTKINLLFLSFPGLSLSVACLLVSEEGGSLLFPSSSFLIAVAEKKEKIRCVEIQSQIPPPPPPTAAAAAVCQGIPIPVSLSTQKD